MPRCTPSWCRSWSAPTGSYDVIVVDFYWVGEFTKAGWLQPLDERIQQDNLDTSVYFDS